MAQDLSPIALIVFGNKRVGKKYRRYVEVARLYTGASYIPKDRPIFEARVTKDVLLNALEKMGARFTSYENGVVRLYSEEDFRRVIVFAGVRQFFANSDWIDFVKSMSDLELLLWGTKFFYMYEKVGYWGVYHVAKAIAILYGLK